MTPRQARLALACFLILAIGVATNALFLQPTTQTLTNAVIAKPQPSKGAERARRKDAPQPGKDAARAVPAPERSIERLAQVRVDSATGVTLSDGPHDELKTLRGIQRELASRGYGSLSGDAAHPTTRAAILHYEQDHSLPLTGEASEALLKHMLFGAAGNAGAAKARSPQAEQVIVQVQRALTRLGYDPGAVDGRLSPETVAAIRIYESDHGMVSTGRISSKLVSRLAGAGNGAPAR
jgi:peptidoglycan hydrolase-like protein with peptidoglycan-binding domain